MKKNEAMRLNHSFAKPYMALRNMFWDVLVLLPRSFMIGMK